MTKKPARYRIMPGPDVDLEVEDIRDSKGNRIDEEYVQRAVADVRRQTAGRPSMSGPGERSPQIAFRVPREVHRAISELAVREGKTLSELAREALEQYVGSEAERGRADQTAASGR